jgi:hypothetical protein
LNQRVGIVVPTLGLRLEYLRKCLTSIREAGDAYVLLVAPKTFDVNSLLAPNLVDAVVPDPGSGLPEAINLGLASLPDSIELINWLGDDDLLLPGSISIAQAELDQFPESVMVFGSCEYIDEAGQVIWKNHSGHWVVPLLRFGPDLIPQPGALFRRAAFNRAGALNPNYDWAFDFDLFIRLSRFGKIHFVKQTLARFRWHPESLSVEFRLKSVAEASAVRVSHLPSFLKPISFIWEYPVRQATLIAGKRVSRKAKSKVQNL